MLCLEHHLLSSVRVIFSNHSNSFVKCGLSKSGPGNDKLGALPGGGVGFFFEKYAGGILV